MSSPPLTRTTKSQLTAEQPSTLKKDWGLPWWRSGYESACQCRGHGFDSWSGKIPHAPQLLSLCSRARVPQLLKPVHLLLFSATREATAMRSPCTATESNPCSPQPEKAHTQQQRPNATKNKNK